jgi:hypothetical protein
MSWKRVGKFIQRAAKKDMGYMQAGKLPGGMANPLGGMMGGMGGSQQGGNTTIEMAGQTPEDQARSQAAQAMKRQAGGAQISFTGDGSTPVSTAS